MRKVLLALLATTAMVSSAHASDYGVRESTAYFGELVHKWETGNYWTSVEQELTDASYNAQGIAGTGHDSSHGWCNEAIVWAMDQVDVFDQAEIDPGWLNTMRGRHFTDHYNSNVVQTFNHNDTFDWDNVPIGTVALMDWDSTPKNWGNLNINHTTTFMGKVNDEWGWFLGGNQSGKLQPKLYKLNQMTFGSTFAQQDHTANKRYFSDVEEMASIKLKDGTWTESTVSGWGWGNNKAAKNAGFGNKMSHQWNNHGLNIQKFESGDNIIYIQSDDDMIELDGRLIRYADYFDQKEINEMAEHIGEFPIFSRGIQKDHKWWSSRNNQSFSDFKETTGEDGTQWHDRVLTAKAVSEAINGQFERTVWSLVNTHRDHQSEMGPAFMNAFANETNDDRKDHYDHSLARELYIEYGVEYYNADDTLMSDHYETQ